MRRELLHVCQDYEQQPDSLWPVVSDLDRYADHVKGLAATPVTSGSGKGTIRECETIKGDCWRESVVEWVEGSHYVIEVDASTYPTPLRQLFRRFTATWTVQPTGDGCRVCISMVPDVRGGWLVWPIVVIGARQSKRDLQYTLRSYQRAAQA